MTLQQRIRETLEDYAHFQRIHNQVDNQGWVERTDQAVSEINKAVLEYKETHHEEYYEYSNKFDYIPAELFEEQVNE